ncbi:hypothetical protein [Methyloglobulus sp.]|uniref:hypothetical protein n=1 Tax=Methyloglobulus sp. TaxID=2518622 RepID=UPI0032B79236
MSEIEKLTGILTLEPIKICKIAPSTPKKHLLGLNRGTEGTNLPSGSLTTQLATTVLKLFILVFHHFI